MHFTTTQRAISRALIGVVFGIVFASIVYRSLESQGTLGQHGWQPIFVVVFSLATLLGAIGLYKMQTQRKSARPDELVNDDARSEP